MNQLQMRPGAPSAFYRTKCTQPFHAPLEILKAWTVMRAPPNFSRTISPTLNAIASPNHRLRTPSLSPGYACLWPRRGKRTMWEAVPSKLRKKLSFRASCAHGCASIHRARAEASTGGCCPSGYRLVPKSQRCVALVGQVRLVAMVKLRNGRPMFRVRSQ